MERTGSTRIVAVGVLIASIAMSFAAPAQATSAAKAWGSNETGQLGDGTHTGPEKCGPSMGTPCSTIPVPVSNLSGVTAVAGGEEGFSLALLENGTVMAWGNGEGGKLPASDLGGELGDGTLTRSDVPVGVCEVGYSGEAPCSPEHYLHGVVAIAAGRGLALALLSNETVVAWGGIAFAGPGNGSTGRSLVPVGVCEVGYSGPAPCSSEHLLREVSAIAVGSNFALVVHASSGKVASWGASTLGTGGEENERSLVPVEVKNLSGVSAVAAGRDLGMALSAGKIYAWGGNGFGQLGDGTHATRNEPAEVHGLSEEATAIAAGDNFGVARLKEGTVQAWGENSDGQLGNGTTVNVPVPVTVAGLKGVTSISAGFRHVLALLKDGTVRAWGENSAGELGDGTSLGPAECPAESFETCSTTPVQVQGLQFTEGIGASGLARHSLAFGPVPKITGISVLENAPANRPTPRGPASGGTTIEINGTGLVGITEVKFGSAVATNSPSLRAVSPGGPVGPVDVTVTNLWGTSATSAVDRFTYIPSVTSVSPNSGSVAGGTPVTIHGSGFALGTRGTKFVFGHASPTSVNCSSSTECTAVAPSHEAGTVNVLATVSKIRSNTNHPEAQFTYS